MAEQCGGPAPDSWGQFAKSFRGGGDVGHVDHGSHLAHQCVVAFGFFLSQLVFGCVDQRGTLLLVERILLANMLESKCGAVGLVGVPNSDSLENGFWVFVMQAIIKLEALGRLADMERARVTGKEITSLWQTRLGHCLLASGL